MRHAHRDTETGREQNNGLSKKGKHQAKYLRDSLLLIVGDRKSKLLSSPAKRCIETLTPLAKKINALIEISIALQEQQPGESERQFRGRVEEFVRWWTNSQHSLLILCAHGDWIPECTKILLGREISLQKGAFVSLEQTPRGPAVVP